MQTLSAVSGAQKWGWYMTRAFSPDTLISQYKRYLITPHITVSSGSEMLRSQWPIHPLITWITNRRARRRFACCSPESKPPNSHYWAPFFKPQQGLDHGYFPLINSGLKWIEAVFNYGLHQGMVWKALSLPQSRTGLFRPAVPRFSCSSLRLVIRSYGPDKDRCLLWPHYEKKNLAQKVHLKFSKRTGVGEQVEKRKTRRRF